MAKYEFSDPAQRKAYEETLNDPELLTLNTEVKLIEQQIKELGERKKTASGALLARLIKEQTKAEALLAQMQKTQARLDKKKE